MIRLEDIPELDIVKRVAPRNELSGGVDTLEKDAVLVTQDDLLGRCALVKKLTQYVDSPADLMFVALDTDASQITELPIHHLQRYFSLVQLYANAFSEFQDGTPIVAFNQQERCKRIPSKFSTDGTELKVQTINQLHVHIFIEDGSGFEHTTLRELEEEDILDFYDVVGIAFSELLQAKLNIKISEMGWNIQLNSRSYPLGLTFTPLEKPRVDLPTLMVYFQKEYNAAYGDIERVFVEKIVGATRRERLLLYEGLVEKYNLSPSSKRVFKTLALALKDKPTDEEKSFLRLIEGPAITWVLELPWCPRNIKATACPKFFSRGNAMEAIGVWVDQEKRATRKDHSEFYESLKKYITNASLETIS